MGAGFVFAFLALLKLYAHHLGMPPVSYGLVSSLIYGLGFMFLALMHLTIATKQPAMTAANIANAIHTSDGELREAEGLVTLIVDTLRSQVAAILGNVSVAMITATAIAWAYTAFLGHPVVDDHEAGYLLGQLNPGAATAFYAAITGVWLFLSGIIDGYFDNLATYTRIGERVGNLRWLGAVIGPDRARRFGAFIHERLGVIMGNLLFGCMLGMTGVVGVLLGLPIDTLHVAFSAGFLAFALASLASVPAAAVVQASLGVALIGFLNLMVSFLLALYVALRSRGATFAAVPSLLARVGKRIVKNPLRLLLPSVDRTAAAA
jgi:site-specific recombinase